MVFFIHEHQLFRIKLTKPGTPEVVRISSQTDICSIGGVAQTDNTGLDAWIWVNTATNGDCQSFVYSQALVRASSSSTTPATFINPSVFIGTTATGNGQLEWMLAVDRSDLNAPKLVAYSPSLTKIDIVDNDPQLTLPGVITPDTLPAGPAITDGVYLHTGSGVGSKLRRLSGDATKLALETPAYTYTGRSAGLGMKDGNTLYFRDDNKLVAVENAGAAKVLATLSPANGAMEGFAQTKTHVIAHLRSGDGTISTSSISKATGSITTLITGNSSGNNHRPLAVTSDTVYYITGRSDKLGDIRRVKIDGSGDATVKSGVYIDSGHVLGQSQANIDFTNIYYSGISSIYYCTPLTGAIDCRNGTLNQFDLDKQIEIKLGTLATGSSLIWKIEPDRASMADGSLVIPIKGKSTAASTEYERKDMWVSKAGQANSLQRVTTNMP